MQSRRIIPQLAAALLATGVLTSPAAAQVVGDSGFETPDVGQGTALAYQYNPTGTPWVFMPEGSASGSGVAANGSDFSAATAPEGKQVAFLQGVTTFTQDISGFRGGTAYVVDFDAARRVNRGFGYDGFEDFSVFLDSTFLGTFFPAVTTFQSFTTASVTPSAGTHTLRFVGLDTVGGDNTAFFDEVRLRVVPAPEPSPIATLLLGLLGLATLIRRARKRVCPVSSSADRQHAAINK